MQNCRLCGKKAAQAIGFCPSCLKALSDNNKILQLHEPVRRRYNLPLKPPQSKEGLSCSLCANNCQMAPGEKGYNLAVFFYGCSFNCLFCQNSSHKIVARAPRITEQELIDAALAEEVRCVCFFGGSPEPQFSFALQVAKKISSQSNKYICWEWNGCGNQRLVKRAAALSLASLGPCKV